MNSGRKATVLMNDMDEKKAAVLPQAKTLFLNSSRWMIGSLAWVSAQTNRAALTTKPANSPKIWTDSQGYFWPPKVRAKSRNIQAAIDRMAPRKSIVPLRA